MSPDGSAHLTLGRRGEDAAVAHLAALGWRVLDRNWRCPRGELDIIALDPAARRPTLVIVEVKTRGGIGFGSGAQAVTWEKYQRLRRLTALWLQSHPMPRCDVRIDVISILLLPGAAPRLDHLRGAYR